MFVIWESVNFFLVVWEIEYEKGWVIFLNFGIRMDLMELWFEI